MNALTRLIYGTNERAKVADVTAIKALYDAACTNVTFVKSDASKGVHNPSYARALLDAAAAKIEQLKKSL